MYLYTRFPVPGMPKLRRKSSLKSLIEDDLHDFYTISWYSLWFLWHFAEDPEDTSLASAREQEEACAEMKLRKAEEIEEIRNWSRKHWAPFLAYDQAREFLDYWIREHARVQGKLQYCAGENAQLQKELEDCASKITWYQEELRNPARYAGEDEDEFE
jgi:hypothetical protein